MLCCRVDEISLPERQDPQGALKTEISAIANVVSKLSERVDRLDVEARVSASPVQPRSPLRQPRTPEQHSGLVGDAHGHSTDDFKRNCEMGKCEPGGRAFHQQVLPNQPQQGASNSRTPERISGAPPPQ